MYSARQLNSQLAIIAIWAVCVGLPDSLMADQVNFEPAKRRAVVAVVPPGWEDSLADWSAYRRSQGYEILLSNPGHDAEETKSAIAKLAEVGQYDQLFILLAADSTPINQRQLSQVDSGFVPTFYAVSSAVVNFGGDTMIATDYVYGDLNQDGIAECPVGRIPAQSPEQLRFFAQRAIDYEREIKPGDWQYEMNMTAGIGGFSMLTDLAISGFAKALLTEALPPEFVLQLTHASENSPYYPSAAKFRDAVVDRINRGSLLWVYVGHGNVMQLDQIREQERFYPILSVEDAAELKTNNAGSIAILLACYSGATDATQGCLAEEMVRQPQGPIAAIAASRVSMPYGMSVLAKEMLHQMFVNRSETLGEILFNAKTAVAHHVDAGEQESPANLDLLMDSMAAALSPAGHDLAQERREHLWLMNLIGDPTLRMRYSEPLEFECSPELTKTRKVQIRGQAAFAGELTANCQYERGRIPRPALRMMSETAKAKRANGVVSDEDLLALYNAANAIVVSESNKAVAAGDFVIELELPEEATGRLVVRTALSNRDQSAVGVQVIDL